MEKLKEGIKGDDKMMLGIQKRLYSYREMK